MAAVTMATPTTRWTSAGTNVPTTARTNTHAFGLTHWNANPCHSVGGSATTARPTPPPRSTRNAM
jgi:hypothetical protein